MRLRLICYDITDDRLRGKISDTLMRMGAYRLQKSVFIANQKEEEFLKMKQEIRGVMTLSEEKSDSIYFIVVSQDMFTRMHYEGQYPDVEMILDKKICLWL